MIAALPGAACLGLLMTGLTVVAAEPRSIVVGADQPGIPVASTMHGLFFEDINYGADGGLYAELVQNRSFEHREPLYSWTEAFRDGAEGRVVVEDESPLNANNTHFLRIFVNKPGTNGCGVMNSGFDGIALHKGDRYLFSIYARQRAGRNNALRIVLEHDAGQSIVSTEISGLGTSWKKFETTLTSSATVTNARLELLATAEGVVDVDMVSLFPEKTFKGRPNGLRADLAQTLADMKPGFLRFPGGCIVEGRDFNNMYRWKDTIGDVAERKQNWNVWQDRRSPQYSQTYGLGFFEYFQFAEDIGAEPLPVINCGMCCQARQGRFVPLAELDPFVQDALDLIEFANGPATSDWGAKRVAMGHPAPFNLKYLAVGNEQWQQDYFDRYIVFYRAIKAKYPEIQIISSAGPFASDAHWRFAWEKFRSGTPADVVDEHYYVPPHWLLENVDRYESFKRNGPKIFVGEFAAHDGGARRSTLRAALAEAAYMTGLWKNADVVIMASYAPLFGKFGHDQWHPNLIWFDNTRVMLTPSYYAQALFAQNRPDIALPVKVEAPVEELQPHGMIGVGTWNTQAEYKDVRVTAPDGRVLYESDFSKGTEGWRTTGGDWSVADGALQQKGGGENIRAVTGDPSWTDYTLTLKARKLGGEEGFLVLFHTRDADNPVWWNIGGWRNTEHALQGEGVVEERVRGSIELNRWYDIRIELKGSSVKAFLDDKLIHEAQCKPAASLFAGAGFKGAGAAKELVLSVVNVSSEPCETTVQLQGVSRVTKAAHLTVLTSTDPSDVNSLDAPNTVKPVTQDVQISGPSFNRVFPANSLSVLRIKTEN